MTLGVVQKGQGRGLEGTGRTYRCTDSHGLLLWAGVGSAGDRLQPQV